MNMPATCRKVRQRQGRRYVWVEEWYYDADRMAKAGILTNFSPGAPLRVGDRVDVLRTNPGNGYEGTSWIITGFAMGGAQCERYAAEQDAG